MLDSLYISATGLQAQQVNVDAISNNLANVNTTAYKSSRVSFEDLLYRAVVRTSPLLGADAAARVGAGVAVGDTSKNFADGDLKQTGVPLDLALRGAGFFELLLPDGSSAFTRNGALQVNKDGLLSTAEGNVIVPQLQIPQEATQIAVDATGHVTATVPGQTTPVEVGQIELARFINPAGLNATGNSLYLPTEGSGDPIRGKAGDAGFGTLTQGFL